MRLFLLYVTPPEDTSDWTDEGFRQHAHDAILASAKSGTRALLEAARTYGVVPEAAIPITKSR